jgi:hypothetical protein
VWRGDGSAADLFGLRVANTAVQVTFSRRREHNEPVAQPAYAFVNGRDYGGLVYGRTSTIMETMRRVYTGERVMRAFGRYARRQRFRHPVPDDLLVAMEEELGPEARASLQSALFDRGWIDFVVEDVVTHKVHQAAGLFDDSGARATVATGTGETGDEEGFAVVMRRGSIVLPVDIELVAADGTRTRTTWDGHGNATRIPYRGRSPLAFAVVDPEHKILIDDELTNNFGASIEAPRAGTRRTLERTTYWSELIASFLFP